MMKYEDVTTIENGLKAMLEDEEKGIAEYEKKITEASRLGAFTTAMELQKIKQQESAHADMLRILIGRAEFAKFGMLPGQETGAVMEDRGEARFVRPPLKEMPKVPAQKGHLLCKNTNTGIIYYTPRTNLRIFLVAGANPM